MAGRGPGRSRDSGRVRRESRRSPHPACPRGPRSRPGRHPVGPDRGRRAGMRLEPLGDLSGARQVAAPQGRALCTREEHVADVGFLGGEQELPARLVVRPGEQRPIAAQDVHGGGAECVRGLRGEPLHGRQRRVGRLAAGDPQQPLDRQAAHLVERAQRGVGPRVSEIAARPRPGPRPSPRPSKTVYSRLIAAQFASDRLPTRRARLTARSSTSRPCRGSASIEAARLESARISAATNPPRMGEVHGGLEERRSPRVPGRDTPSDEPLLLNVSAMTRSRWRALRDLERAIRRLDRARRVRRRACRHARGC